MATERNAQGVLSASERKEFLSALDEPMTDDEAVGLIAELVTLTCAVAKVATAEQQKALTPTLIRAGNMVPYVAHRLADVAELVEAGKDARRTARLMHDDRQQEVVCIQPAEWRAFCAALAKFPEPRP